MEEHSENHMIEYARNTDGVGIHHNDETGVHYWSVAPIDVWDHWIDSFETLQEAWVFCVRYNLGVSYVVCTIDQCAQCAPKR
jgi:hypothetical protein